jgi:hypothetical protein
MILPVRRVGEIGEQHRAGCGLIAELAGHERFHPVQQAQHLGQGQIPGRGIVPVPVERGLRAGGGQLRHPRLRRPPRRSLRPA